MLYFGPDDTDPSTGPTESAITLAGHPQRLGEITERTLRAWLDHRRATWPYTPNRHVPISGKTALGVQPVSKHYFQHHLRDHGIRPERIRGDRILHEALAVGPDPLHLSLVFNLSHTTASRYAGIAEQLLDTPTEAPNTPKPPRSRYRPQTNPP